MQKELTIPRYRQIIQPRIPISRLESLQFPSPFSRVINSKGNGPASMAPTRQLQVLRAQLLNGPTIEQRIDWPGSLERALSWYKDVWLGREAVIEPG